MTRLRLNLNGDHPDTLIREYMELVNALSVVEKRMAEIIPHRRNYLHNGGDIDYAADREEFMDHVQNMRKVVKWAENNAVEIMRQRDVRG